MNDRQKNVARYCDGLKTSKEIAALCGDNQKYVQKTMRKFDLPRLPIGARAGKNNPSYVSGRRIDRDGYVIVSAPAGHPYARTRKDRNYGLILEHRLVVERELGRYLEPQEIVDHIDGLRLHNDASNLRVFQSNAEHLKNTITGQVPNWTKEGLRRMNSSRRQREASQPVHTYRKMRASGDARIIQIILAALKLGIDSPYLLGTSHHLKKAGISDLSHSSLKHALACLYRKYA